MVDFRDEDATIVRMAAILAVDWGLPDVNSCDVSDAYGVSNSPYGVAVVIGNSESRSADATKVEISEVKACISFIATRSVDDGGRHCIHYVASSSQIYWEKRVFNLEVVIGENGVVEAFKSELVSEKV